MLTRLAFEIDTSEIGEADIKLRALGSALDGLARRRRVRSSRDDVQGFRRNATRKMKNMVLAFAMNVAHYAREYTPVGDAFRIENDKSYRSWYEKREEQYGIEMEPGFHQGAWHYSESRVPGFDNTIYPYESVTTRLKADFLANYKLGDKFYIAAKGPAFAIFEGGHNPQVGPEGIVKPTLDSVMAVYANTLLNAYKRG